MATLTSRKLYIDGKTLSRGIAYLVVLSPFCFALMEMLGLSGIMKLVVDCLWLCLAVLPVLRGKLNIKRKMLPLVIIVALFVVDTLLVYLFRFQSPFYYLWGFRNYFRFYVLFFSITAYWSEEDCGHCFRWFDNLFWVNAVLCLVQFFMGYKQDYMGGMFGVTKGCNGDMIVYLCIVVCKTLLSYMNGTASTFSCLSKSAASLIIAAMAELKFFFFVFILMMLMAMVLTSFSFKKMIFLMVGTVLISVTATVLGSIHESFQGFLSIDTLVDALTRTNYASSVDMGRFNGIDVISKRFLTDIPSRLFGMGLGNCDVSSFSIFSTPFYAAYRDLHYAIFSYAFMFIENGYVGLILYVLFFVVCLVRAWKRFKSGTGNKLFSQMAIIISTMCFMLIFYNSSLRTEAGFMIYFVLALPFIDSDAPKQLNQGERVSK